MCRRLAVLVIVLTCLSAPTASQALCLTDEQDKSAGQLIVSLAVLLNAQASVSPEIRSALGSSMELAFVLLQRSESDAAIAALASTALLKLDGGAAEMRDAALIAKGKRLVPKLDEVLQHDYDRLCNGAMQNACMSRQDAERYGLSIRKQLAVDRS